MRKNVFAFNKVYGEFVLTYIELGSNRQVITVYEITVTKADLIVVVVER